jgi:hypothetical protein
MIGKTASFGVIIPRELGCVSSQVFVGIFRKQDYCSGCSGQSRSRMLLRMIIIELSVESTTSARRDRRSVKAVLAALLIAPFTSSVFPFLSRWRDKNAPIKSTLSESKHHFPENTSGFCHPCGACLVAIDTEHDVSIWGGW